MATSSITRNFMVEGQNVEDFANSITDEKVIDKALEGIFKNVSL